MLTVLTTNVIDNIINEITIGNVENNPILILIAQYLNDIKKYLNKIPYNKLTTHIYQSLVIIIDKWFRQYNFITKQIPYYNINNIYCFNVRFAKSIRETIIPEQTYSQSTSLLNSCAIHSIMILLDSLCISTDFFNHHSTQDLRLFIETFNSLNNNKLCTCESEISDVLRSLNAIYSYLIPKEILNIFVCTKDSFEYNLSDFVSMDFINTNPINSKFIIFDIGMYANLVNKPITKHMTINNQHYILFGIIENTGSHYITHLIWNKYINEYPPISYTQNCPNQIVYTYDDLLKPNNYYISTNKTFVLNNIGVLLYCLVD